MVIIIIRAMVTTLPPDPHHLTPSLHHLPDQEEDPGTLDLQASVPDLVPLMVIIRMGRLVSRESEQSTTGTELRLRGRLLHIMTIGGERSIMMTEEGAETIMMTGGEKMTSRTEEEPAVTEKTGEEEDVRILTCILIIFSLTNVCLYITAHRDLS